MIARSPWNLRTLLALLLSAGLVHTAVAQSAAAPAAPKPADEKDSALELEKFEVTGSRVKRLDTETPAPVVAYKMADIEAKGYTNIGDFIQSLPFNTGSANSIYQTASFTRGAATANPRGLGSQRFLTLVDGRRPATYALPTGGNRQVFDFNSLPAAAIDSVEFLKDGASAIYGADAVTGVFNVKLKKNYTGLSTQAYYGNTLGHDSSVKQFSIVAGAGAGQTRAMVAFDFKTGNSNFLRDYGVTTTDYSLSLGTNLGANLNSTLNWPANITLSTAQGAVHGLPSGTYVVTGGRLLSNPTISDFVRVTTVPAENRYNFADVYQRYPAYDYMSAYAQMEHDFNDNVTVFGTASFADNRTYYAFTPGVINFSTEGLSLPINSPFNPFGTALTGLLARTSFGPVRKFDTESISGNFVGGVRGSFNQWDWETAMTYGFNQVSSVARNAIRATTYQSALNGTLSGFSGVFFNPFGPSNAALAKALFTSSTGMNKGEGISWDATVTNGAIFALPGGDVGMAAGVEFRNDRIQTNPDTAAYLGSGGGQPLRGERDVSSAYVELTAPIIAKKLEAQAAVRYEKYSDFGETTNPKFGMKFRQDTPYANIILRSSYSESFQAPPLALLFASQTIGFSSGVLQDPLRPQDPPQQQRIVTGGNPNLIPEEGETIYGGIVVEIPALKDFSFNIDYFKFRINQVIVTPSATFLLSERGRAQFPNAIVRDGAGGPIVRIDSVPSNNPAAYQLYKGYDFGINYRIRNTRLGDFTLAAEATRTYEIGNDTGLGSGYFNNIGLWNNPKWRGNASVGWRMKDWSASVVSDYIGKYYNDAYTVAGWAQNPYTLVHTAVSYRGLWNSTITIGANNVFDNLPPANGRDTGGFDPNTYGAGALGRFVYVRVRKDF
ncbi:MAG: TonB-dependent receptor [Candidatus Didemnitutus sp.]|nr:TonB-dependent receptor [Candidatus Didemnitutus sp.]